MKLLTQNVKKWPSQNHLMLADEVIAQDADVVILTEYLNNKRGIEALNRFKNSGYTHVVTANDVVNDKLGGLAICSKKEFHQITNGFETLEQPWRTISMECRGKLITGCYWPQKHEKKPYFEALLKLCRQHQSHIIIGDLNTGKNSVDKSDNGAKFHCESYMHQLEDVGMLDAWRLHHGDKREYTWFSIKNGSPLNGFRVDHTFISPDLKERVLRCDYLPSVREKRLTDHSGMMIEING